MAENDPDDLSGLPLEPTPEQLRAAYQLCRRKLASANRSRTALRVHDDYRNSLIGKLNPELEKLADSLRKQVIDRVAIHALKQRIMEIIKSIEVNFDEAATIADEKDSGGLRGWAVRFARLLHVVLRLRKIRADARRLLGREHHRSSLPAPSAAPETLSTGPELESELHPEPLKTVSIVLPVQMDLLPPPEPPSPPPHPFVSPLPTPPTAPTALPDEASKERSPGAYGPLVLQFMGSSFGLLLLPTDNQPLPDGLIRQPNSPWLPGHTLLVQPDAEDPDLAAIDVGFLAIEQEQPLVPELQPWLDRGLLPFALDPQLKLPRLVHKASLGSISHVLVREAQASVFHEQIGGTRFDLDSDQWLAFQLNPEEAEAFWHVLDLAPGRSREQAPRLGTRGGVAMVDRQGFLSTGLGLPLLTAPWVFELQRVQLQLADDLVLDYIRSLQGDDSEDRQIWQPSPQDRGRVALAEGPARFTGWLADGSSLQRTIQLTALSEWVRFQRVNPIAYREDWGTSLGPIELPEPIPATTKPSTAALQWARQRLNQGDANVRRCSSSRCSRVCRRCSNGAPRYSAAIFCASTPSYATSRMNGRASRMQCCAAGVRAAGWRKGWNAGAAAGACNRSIRAWSA
jgi:hypothetical protein